MPRRKYYGNFAENLYILHTMIDIKTLLAASAFTLAGSSEVKAQNASNEFIGKQQPALQSDRMTPEALWAMGRIGDFNVAENGKQAVYAVSYYSVKQNKSHSVLYTLDLNTRKSTQLTTSTQSESGAVFMKDGKRIAYMSAENGSNQLWMMNADGTNRKQVSNTGKDIAGFLFSPDEKQVILVMEVDQNHSIAKNDADLPEATGMVINDLMYKHCTPPLCGFIRRQRCWSDEGFAGRRTLRKPHDALWRYGTAGLEP